MSGPLFQRGVLFQSPGSASGGGGGGPDLSDATPQPVGSASAGVSSDASRADHVHAHGNQAGGTLHAEATTSTAGFMSAADKVKLDGLVAYDPLNDPDLLTLAG